MNTDFARRQMVSQQVRAWHVFDDDVLDVFNTVPREEFVPPGYESIAFADTEIPIGHGELMMTPTIEGRVLQALGLSGGEQVLEVGTGSGFLTACLAQLAAHVTSIDIHEDFIAHAAQKLSERKITNVQLEKMDAMAELPHGEFDAIAVTGSIENFDPRFVAALAPGGRLFVVVGEAPAMNAKIVVRTDENDWYSESLFETELAPLTNGSLPPQFRF
ncbi:MAG: protein-L-isoaspartate O-methyltransferase [Pseudomonadota bacterium]